MDNDWIKLHRKFLDWEWYKDKNTKILFIHFLLRANWKEQPFEGKKIHRGQFVSSVKALSEETGLSEKEVRTAINHLKRTNEVASTSTSKFSIFTVKNYDQYQSRGEPSGKQRASEGQAKGKQGATIEEGKNSKKERIPPLYSPQRGDAPDGDPSSLDFETRQKLMADGWGWEDGKWVRTK